jgi:hypothetical protein
VFIPARRYVRPAKSAAAVYGNQVRIRPNLWLHVRIDLADIATVAHVLAIDVRANADNAVGRRDAATGLPAHSRVEDAAGVVKERATTDGGIEVAGGVIGKRVSTDGRVHVAGRVAKERAIAYGSVEVACGVALKRAVTGGDVVVAFGVTRECQRTIGSIEVACAVVMQRRNASGRISSPRRVIKECNSANRRVVVGDRIL